jgi:hypothetical protein
MTAMAYPCDVVTQSRRPCTNHGVYHLGALAFCNTHVSKVIEGITYAAESDQSFIVTPLVQLAQRTWHHQRDLAAEERERQRDEWRQANSVVYFVQRERFIKIGTTTRIDDRVKALTKGGASMPQGMTVGPVRLLATIPGGLGLERELHAQFAAYRSPGTEWFEDHADLREYIAGIREQVAS